MNHSPPGSSVHEDSPGKNTGVGCHVLLQGIFPTQVSRIAGRFFTGKKKSFFNNNNKKKLPCPLPWDLSNPGMELGFPALQANSLPAELPGSPYCNLSTHKISRKINYNIKEETRNYLYVLQCVRVCLVACHVQLSVIPWTVANQAPLSTGFLRQEYQHGLPFPPPGDLPHPGIKPEPPALAGIFFTTEPPGKPHISVCKYTEK